MMAQIQPDHLKNRGSGPVYVHHVYDRLKSMCCSTYVQCALFAYFNFIVLLWNILWHNLWLHTWHVSLQCSNIICEFTLRCVKEYT